VIARPARDSRLLDAVEALPSEPFAGTSYRVVRDGRDPVQCSAVGGRWDDRTFDVLYTSTRADGALAEMYFHLSRGQPAIPSQVQYRLHELKVTLTSCVRNPSVDALGPLGFKTAVFGQLSYFEREQEYPRTQEIAARSEHPNVLVFCGPAGLGAREVVRDGGVIQWEDWRREPLGF
jgi:hypothetical protein